MKNISIRFTALLTVMFLWNLTFATSSIRMVAPDTVAGVLNTQFTIDIEVGNPDSVSNLIGVSFFISWDDTTLVEGLDAIPGNFLGNNPIFLKQIYNDHMEIGISSTSGGHNGSGIVVQTFFTVKKDVTVNDSIHFTISNISAIDAYGNSLSLEPVVNPITIFIRSNSPNTITINKNVILGWNMLGLPVQPADAYYLSVFPSAIPSTLYGFNGSYYQPDTLEPGHGYWLCFSAAETVPITGVPLNSLTIDLMNGWNMISGGSCDFPIAGVSDPGGIIMPGTLYGFDGSYQTSDTLRPGDGYWLRTTASGQISLSCSAKNNGGFARLTQSLVDLSTFPSVQITEATGLSQTLYLGMDLPEEVNRLSYSLPPLPPAGAFDARFSGDMRISEGEEGVIEIQSSHYPVRISVNNLPAEAGSPFTLTELVNGKEGTVYTLTEGEVVKITNPQVRRVKIGRQKMVPLTFSVEQNYPNPFNPTTRIKYVLPSPDKITLAIYNALGQKVKTLVDKQHDAGYYSVVWDGTNDVGERVGSGIYFYVLKAGRYRAIKKMLLVK